MTKQLEDIISGIVIILAFLYVHGYMLSGKARSPLSFRYNQLFTWNKLKYHLIIALIISILGYFRFNSLTLETYYFTPLIFIVSTLLSNEIVKFFYKRNILLEIPSRTGWRFSRNAKRLDKILLFFILINSMATPILMKYKKFDEINNRSKKEINTAHNSGLAALLV